MDAVRGMLIGEAIEVDQAGDEARRIPAEEAEL
jgi:hypothetical protein